MAGFTNKGKFRMLGWVFNAVALPTNFYVALVRSTTAPTQDTNTLGELTEISTATGYTSGGIQLTKNTTDFPSILEDDANDWGEIFIKDLVWTASGGNLDSGAGARYAILTDDNGTVGSREVFAYFDLVSDRNVSDTQTLTLTLSEMRITET